MWIYLLIICSMREWILPSNACNLPAWLDGQWTDGFSGSMTFAILSATPILKWPNVQLYGENRTFVCLYSANDVMVWRSSSPVGSRSGEFYMYACILYKQIDTETAFYYLLNDNNVNVLPSSGRIYESLNPNDAMCNTCQTTSILTEDDFYVISKRGETDKSIIENPRFGDNPCDPTTTQLTTTLLHTPTCSLGNQSISGIDSFTRDRIFYDIKSSILNWNIKAHGFDVSTWICLSIMSDVVLWRSKERINKENTNLYLYACMATQRENSNVYYYLLNEKNANTEPGGGRIYESEESAMSICEVCKDPNVIGLNEDTDFYVIQTDVSTDISKPLLPDFICTAEKNSGNKAVFSRLLQLNLIFFTIWMHEK